MPLILRGLGTSPKGGDICPGFLCLCHECAYVRNTEGKAMEKIDSLKECIRCLCSYHEFLTLPELPDDEEKLHAILDNMENTLDMYEEWREK